MRETEREVELLALQGALARMLREAQALAELEPDIPLVDSVLTATVGRRPLVASRRPREETKLF